MTIRSGESLFVPPSYKMICSTHYSYSQDSYGGIPDYTHISEGSDNIINEELSINMTTENGPTQQWSSNNDLSNANESCSSLSDSTSLNLTGGSITPTATISELAFTSCPNLKSARNGNFCISGTGG